MIAMADNILDSFNRHDRGELVNALKIAGAVFKGNAIKCPFHDDKTPSAAVYQADDGVWRFKCHGCGVCDDIVGIMARTENKTSADVLRDARRDQTPAVAKAPPKVYPTIDALKASVSGLENCYVYTDPVTKLPSMIVMRIKKEGGKTFIQASPSGDGFAMIAPPKPWPIYNRSRIVGAKVVFVVEGEKCCHALLDSGYTATTSPGGAGKAAMADWTPLAGKEVYIWRDNDPPDDKGVSKGAQHMRDVQRELEKLSPLPLVYWIEPSDWDLPPKGDVVEYLELYGGDTSESKKDAIACAMQTAKPVGGAACLRQRIDDAKSGKMRSVAWPWSNLTSYSKSLFSGTVTAICADPGSGKSFFALDAFAYWHRNGIKAAAYMLEDEKAYHLNRILAQLEENGDVADVDWQRENPDKIEAAWDRHRRELDAMAPWLDATDEPESYDWLLEWMRRQCARSARVLIVDPITAIPVNDRPWAEDQRFMREAKKIVAQWQASLVLMTHPRGGKSGSKGSLSDMSGGQAFPRFSHSVFWIDRHDQPKPVTVTCARGDFKTSVNRTIRMSKTRNGRGAGLAIGYTFAHTLRFAEQGIIMKENKISEVEKAVSQHDPFGSSEKP